MSFKLNEQNVVVVGAGCSGIAVTSFLVAKGAQVILSDRRTADEINATHQLLSTLNAAVSCDFGGHTTQLFVDADLIVISPGVPLSIAPLRAAISAGVPIVGEVELAARYLCCPMIAITGTNGKSTTTELIGTMLQNCAQQVFVGGNLGTPLIEAVADYYAYAVVELSSFQLETVDLFHPRYALLLNLSLDHLDRYPDMASYIAAKGAILHRLNSNDVAILNRDDAAVMKLAENCSAQQVLFSSQQRLYKGMSYLDGRIEWRGYGATLCFDATKLQLSGSHNVENVMAALIAPLLEGYDPQLLWQAACNFGGLPHRMVLVRELDGVRWYNDSKGTNPGSVLKSVAGIADDCRATITLIAGGKDKGGDYHDMRSCLQGKVAQFVLLGEAAATMEQAWSDIAPVHRVVTMQQAVDLSRQITVRGGSVLLSPGCSSFDMFSSYQQRGEVFTAAVEALQCNNIPTMET